MHFHVVEGIVECKTELGFGLGFNFAVEVVIVHIDLSHSLFLELLPEHILLLFLGLRFGFERKQGQLVTD